MWKVTVTHVHVPGVHTKMSESRGPYFPHLSRVFAHEFSVCEINFFPSSIKNLLKLTHYFMYYERVKATNRSFHVPTTETSQL